MMTKEGFTKIVTFMTPGAGVFVQGCDHMSHIVKMHYYFKNLLLYSQTWIRQTKFNVYSINDQGRVYKNYKLHDPRGWGSDVRTWPYKHLL